APRLPGRGRHMPGRLSLQRRPGTRPRRRPWSEVRQGRKVLAAPGPPPRGGQARLRVQCQPGGRCCHPSSIARFFLVSNSKNGDVLPVEAVEGDIATVAEVDQPFPKLGFHVLDRPADVWLM